MVDRCAAADHCAAVDRYAAVDRNAAADPAVGRVLPSVVELQAAPGSQAFPLLRVVLKYQVEPVDQVDRYDLVLAYRFAQAAREN